MDKTSEYLKRVYNLVQDPIRCGGCGSCNG